MATRIERDTANAMIAKLQGELDDLYNEQESMKCGGSVKKKMQDGSEVPRLTGKGLNINTYNPLNLMGQAPIIDPLSSLPMVNPVDTTKLMGTDATGFFGDRYGSLVPEQGFFGKAWDWANENDVFYKAGVAAPAIYNLVQGLRKPEQEYAPDFYNPYTGDILGTLRQRKYDISPVLEANKAAQRIYNRNVINASGGNRGALLGNLGAGMTNRQQADAAAYAQASNIQNQYMADLANAQMGLGNQMAQMNFNVADINARNRAARRAYLGQAAGDLSGLLQTNRLMSNQEQRDQERMGLLPDIFSTVAPFLSFLGGGK